MKTHPWLPTWPFFGAAMLVLLVVEAGVRTSADYSIDVETLDSGGRASSSANYTQAPSVATAAVGTSGSTDYSVDHGFIPPVYSRNPPPTAARVAYFRAVRMLGGEVDLKWRTLVEVGVLGFRVERFVPYAGWERVAENFIPAEGQSIGRLYVLKDTTVAAGVPPDYRLVEVDVWGEEHVVAESSTTPALEIRFLRNDTGLVLRLMGEPGARAVVEAAERVQGPWRRIGVVTLDERGGQSSPLDLSESPTAQFVRALHD